MLPIVSAMETAVVESEAPWEPLMTQSKLPVVTLLGYTAVDVVLVIVVLHATCGVPDTMTSATDISRLFLLNLRYYWGRYWGLLTILAKSVIMCVEAIYERNY